MDENDKTPAPVGILSPIFDWTEEQRAPADRELVQNNAEFEMLVYELQKSGYCVSVRSKWVN